MSQRKPAAHNRSEIQTDDNFALIALPKANISASIAELSLGENLWITRRLPLPADDFWWQQMGTLMAKRLDEAGVFLIAKNAANDPDIIGRIKILYRSLIIAETPECLMEPLLLAGTQTPGRIRMRQIITLRHPHRSAFSQGARNRQIDAQDLDMAENLTAKITMINQAPKGEFDRLKLGIGAFNDGIHEVLWEKRLHQFCRCIDGIIKSRSGKGKKDFSIRSALFIGNDHGAFMKELYDMRSAVEHLRPVEDVIKECGDLRAQRTRIIERTVQSEYIARHCLKNVLLNNELLELFRTDDGIENFWNQDESRRRDQWGTALDFEKELATLVDRSLVTREDLALDR